jgi:hypothetical protein
MYGANSLAVVPLATTSGEAPDLIIPEVGLETRRLIYVVEIETVTLGDEVG